MYFYKFSYFSYDGNGEVTVSCATPVTALQLRNNLCIALAAVAKKEYKNGSSAGYLSIERMMDSPRFKKELTKLGYTLLKPDGEVALFGFKHPFSADKDMYESAGDSADDQYVTGFLREYLPKLVEAGKREKRNHARADKRLMLKSKAAEPRVRPDETPVFTCDGVAYYRGAGEPQ